MTTIKKRILELYGTQEKFAEAVGWSQPRVSYIANKPPSEMNGKKLKEIARLLECDTVDLI